ncbi:MAG: hypothetical protein ACRDT4_16035 [Micromonosporaceae bacterium]
MRTVLRWVTTRYGIAGILVLGVLVVVVVTRLAGGEVGRAGDAEAGADPYASVSFGPDHDEIGDPEVNERGERPTLPKGVPDPLPVADAFATAWADHDGVTGEQWRARLAKHATKALMKRLGAADPTSQPSVELTGEPQLDTVIGTDRADVSISARSGVLLLGLRYADRRWAVDSISWRSE